MFGQNEKLKAEHGNGQTLQVVKGSPFLTIQGEGPYVGHPAVFVRLHGCNLACTFCDTQFSDPDDPVVDIADLTSAICLAADGRANLVVITGGEPLRQNIVPLCRLLSVVHGFKVQIETAGTLWLLGLDIYAEIVCSPKTPTIHPAVLSSARAFKYVISTEQKFEPTSYLPITNTQASTRPARLAAPRADCPVYLSPMDVGNEERNWANIHFVGQLAMRHGCIASVQLHKLMGLD